MIKRIEKENYPLYEQFVWAHPRGHFVKSTLWAEFKKPYKTEIFVKLDGDRIIGSMMLFVSKIPKTKFTRFYCPRGPIAEDDKIEILKELVAYTADLAKKENAIELAIDPDITDEDTDYLETLKSVGFVVSNTKNRPEYLQARYVFRLTLTGKTEEELLAAFHHKTRYNIRVAQRNNLTCRIGLKSDLPAFCEIMKETAARDGFMGRGLSYFEQMYDLWAPDKLRLYLVETEEGKAISGAISILYGDKVWYLYGASSNSERNKMPNYLMQWEMIKWALQEGCNIYDFRGVTGDMEKTVLEGLIRFKAGFGAVQCDFVGKLSIFYKPKAAKLIEDLQTAYRSFVRTIKIKK